MIAEDKAGGAFTSPCKGEVGSFAAGWGSKERFNRTKTKTAQARRLRRGQTDAERKLWNALRRDQLGVSFRRQHPAGAYCLDFYCPALKLAVELDGGQHMTETGMKRDALRTRWLEARGVSVLRFSNIDVLTNMPGVLEAISLVLSERRTTPSLTLPLSGGGNRALSEAI